MESRRNDVVLEISHETDPSESVQIHIGKCSQIATAHARKFIGDWIAPYVTLRWICTYAAYAGLFSGLVMLLWYFNSTREMNSAITDVENWYISSTFNAWTSIAYMLPVPFAHVSMKLPLVSLAVSSFCLWSDSGAVTQFIDVTSIHWVILGILFQKTTSSRRYMTTHFVNCVAVAFMTYCIVEGMYRSVLVFYADHILFTVGAVTAFNVLVTFNTHGPRPHLVVGFVICLLGFWCKFRDLLHGDWWGTGVFHLLTAIGLSVALLPTKSI
jgi:hypothetical protein